MRADQLKLKGRDECACNRILLQGSLADVVVMVGQTVIEFQRQINVDALQADLDAWLIHYNTERPHLGYRNMGRRPIETIMSFVSQEG